MNDGDVSLPVTPSGELVHLPLPVKAVAANDHTPTSSSPTARCGDGATTRRGSGDGQEIDFGAVGPHGSGLYAWDWGEDELPVNTPVQIAAHAGRFKAVFTNASDVFYVFAVTEDGHLYSWGRNKTGNLMNGIVSAAPLYGNICATYPNSWEVIAPVSVNPFELSKNTEVTSPYCLTHPTDSPCNQFDNATGKATYEE